LTRSNAKSGQKYHMTPASFRRAPPGGNGEKKEMEKPRPSPAGPRKSLYAYLAHAKHLVHQLKVDSAVRQLYTSVSLRVKLRMTILLKRKRMARGRAAYLRSIQFHGATAFEIAWRALGQAHRGATINLTQPDRTASCLCAISQLGSCMNCRS